MATRNSTRCNIPSQSLNDEFIAKVFIKRHPQHFNQDGSLRYDYSNIVYTNNCTNIAIICSKHGVFYQQPSNHLKGRGCPRCHKTAKHTTEEYIERAKKIHNNFYDYSKTVYKGTRTMLTITCPIHGDFIQKPQTHSDGGGCRKCAGNEILTTDEFVEKSIKKHGSKYIYDKTEYKSNSKKVTITCRWHGDFEQLPDSHMRGKGCLECGALSQGWSKTEFLKACKNNRGGSAVLYILRCFDDNEVFYKVGITSRSIKKRYAGASLPYQFEIVKEVIGSAFAIWDLEVNILRNLSHKKYTPLIKFGGSTECLKDIEGIDIYLKNTA